MSDTKTKNRHISSLAAPTDEDIVIWNNMSAEERQAVIQERADEAAASKTVTANADDIIKSATVKLQAKLEHG